MQQIRVAALVVIQMLMDIQTPHGTSLHYISFNRMVSYGFLMLSMMNTLKYICEVDLVCPRKGFQWPLMRPKFFCSLVH